MPTVSRVAIRLAFLHLVVAVAGWTLLPVVAPWTSSSVLLAGRAVWHLLAVGWLTQLIFGVAYWLFPAHKVEPKRGSPRIAAVSLGLLNFGLLARLVFEPSFGRDPTGSTWGLALAAVCQIAGVMGWTWVLWPRVRGK